MSERLAGLAEAFGLQGRVALVTGSSKGIGEATARILAHAGAHVVISSRHLDDCQRIAAALREEGLSAEAFRCHIGSMKDISHLSAHLDSVHGGMDILVNNAVLSPWRSIEDTDLNLFTKAVEVNLRGYWYMASHAATLMKKRGGGSVVNIGSVAALHPERMLGLYATLKTALLGMSRAFALEFGEHNIRFNTLLPGVIETKLAEAFEPAVRARILAKIPLGQLGRPSDVGYAVLYLCSPAAAYITGASLVIDGGLTIASF